MNKTKLVAFDASTHSTAYAVFEKEDYKESGLIKCKEPLADDRMKSMSVKIINLLRKLKPDIVYIEDTVVTRNAKTQRILTRLQGVIYGYCIINGCEFKTIRPTSWRKAVGINQGKKKRVELKKEAIEMVREKMEIEVNDDEAEAILIGQAAIKEIETIRNAEAGKEE